MKFPSLCFTLCPRYPVSFDLYYFSSFSMKDLLLLFPLRRLWSGTFRTPLSLWRLYVKEPKTNLSRYEIVRFGSSSLYRLLILKDTVWFIQLLTHFMMKSIYNDKKLDPFYLLYYVTCPRTRKLKSCESKIVTEVIQLSRVSELLCVKIGNWYTVRFTNRNHHLIPRFVYNKKGMSNCSLYLKLVK